MLTHRFGSENMCDLLNDNSQLFFDHSFSEVTTAITSTLPISAQVPPTDVCPTRRKRSFLELGSGIGRAGVMAAKLMRMYDTFDFCILTDGNYLGIVLWLLCREEKLQSPT